MTVQSVWISKYLLAMMPITRATNSMTLTACWCGNRELTMFGPDYLQCACGTLVRSTMPLHDITRVGDEEGDLYGRNYWFAHQTALGLPDLEERRVTDLQGRGLHWLRTVLAYKTPPGRVLEIGAGHGAFVALLAAAGFDAAGIELSPWVVDYARRTSGVRMLLGPLEDQQLDPRSFDLIVAFDVLEHLPDPVGTMTRCAELLRDDGLLMLQTPGHQPGVDYSQASGTRFRDMLIPEHLYLFSEGSARQLLQRAGLSAVSTEPPAFETDIVLVAGRRPLARLSAAQVRDSHAGSNAMTIIGALLSLDEAVGRERTARQRQIEALDADYRQADRDRAERLRRIVELETLYQQADQDRIGRQRQVHELEARCREAEAVRVEYVRQVGLAERHQALRALMADHRNSRLYRAMVRLGRWRGFDSRLQPFLDEPRAMHAADGRDIVERTWTLQTASNPRGGGTIAIDLTAILPGAENGGAKLVASELVRALSRVAPAQEFLLLTSAASHHEAAALEAANVRRRMVYPAPTTLSELLDEEPLSVLFCPMGAAPFDDPRVPVVCLINDLQHLTYPEFFDDADRRARGAAFAHVVRTADHVVTPSAYVRATVLEHANLPDAQVTVISHGFSGHRLPRASERGVSETLQRYGLRRGRYFIYPANFWPHKNHLMLLVAFGQLCQRRPDLDLHLVLTGASRPDPGIVEESVRRMRLAGRVTLPGYVPDAELGALLSGALALVFPSLYEGFGMPILEAFAAGCPVACSSVTSLPEVAGEAALYFDPRKPEAIADVLERLAMHPELGDDLRKRGREWLRQMDLPDQIARDYLNVIGRVAAEPRRPRNQLGGAFIDGWTTSSLVVAHTGGSSELQIALENDQDVTVTLAAEGVETIALAPQQALALRCVLLSAVGNLSISIRPTFRPSDRGASSDTRTLGVRLRACRLHRSGADPVDLLGTGADV